MPMKEEMQKKYLNTVCKIVYQLIISDDGTHVSTLFNIGLISIRMDAAHDKFFIISLVFGHPITSCQNLNSLGNNWIF
ncbi:hypothetical protein MXB_5113 [Myxobolus squamalis]|nr:hypothetical protein MXB_5113 [Myxobolus squamalis]